jgi:hypothetical protein
MFKAAERRNFHGALSAVHKRTVQEDFVLGYKSVVKTRTRISTFNPVEKFPGLQEILSQQIIRFLILSFPFSSFIDLALLLSKSNRPLCFSPQADSLSTNK